MENIAPLCAFSQRTLKETEDQDKTSFEHATFEGLTEEAQQKWEIPDDPEMTSLGNDFDVENFSEFFLANSFFVIYKMCINLLAVVGAINQLENTMLRK